VKSLTWKQVNAWRLEQHCLAPRLKRRDYLKAVKRTGGIQAQLMSAAEMAVGVRADGITPEDVQTALWQDRTLVKTWMMRGTLHLLAADDLPLYAAARTAHDDRNWQAYFTYFGMTEEQAEAFKAAVPQVLDADPMTRDELAAAVAEHIGAPEVGKVLTSSSWGSLWKPSALRGDICFGPNRGRNVTFVRPSAWLGEWKPLDPEGALQEIARRYLRAYGPARPQDFAVWWDGGGQLSHAKKLFRSIEDELEEVDVEGWRALALRETLKSMEQSDTKGTVRLLPLFDAYTLGIGRDIEPLLPHARKLEVYRPQGWISAVVLVDGRIKGVWENKAARSQTTVKVRMFLRPSASIRNRIEAEAERLEAYWDSAVAIEFGHAR
jgi:hypothetical protein